MHPAIWIIGGIGAAAFGFRQAGDAADSVTRLTKWGLVAGGGYVAYLGLRKAKVI
jgi:hypothetical protein